MCEDEIAVYITDRLAFMLRDIVWAINRKCCDLKMRALSSEEIHRLARLHAKAAKWQVRTLDLRDKATALFYPSKRAYRDWLRKNMPHALEIAGCRPTEGKPGRKTTMDDIAAYADERKHSMYWKDICSAWKRDHPHDPRTKALTSKQVRDAWRRHYGDKRPERSP
jgi:hypothetical protein